MTKLQAVYLLAILVGALVSVLLWVNLQAQADQGHHARRALCALRADYLHRISETHEFLKNHPNGFAGVSAKTLLLSAENQQQTANLLQKELDCP